MLEGMSETLNPVAVVDFRRSRLLLEWHTGSGSWTACDSPPALVHGIALIRPGQENVCLYGRGGQLKLQIGAQHFTLEETSPVLSCTRPAAGFGLRRQFRVEVDGAELFGHSYWSHQGRDFFQWLAGQAQTPGWRAVAAQRWSDGVEAGELRPA